MAGEGVMARGLSRMGRPDRGFRGIPWERPLRGGRAPRCGPLASLSRWGRSILAALVLLAAAGLTSPPVSAGDAISGAEYQIKAAFLCSIAQFMSWPQGTYSTSDQPIRIGVLDPDPFGHSLDNVANAQTVDGRSLEVVRGAEVAALRSCQLIFVPEQRPITAALMQEVSRPGVVSIGESPEFTARGGIARLFVEDKKVRIEINLPAADRAGIKISSRLLSLCRMTPTTAGNLAQ
jgi:hypothetical protein